MNEKQLKQIQMAIKFLENKTNISSGNEEVKNEDLIKLSSKVKRKDYEEKSKDYTGEKTDGFRKQGEFGPKKFIKP